MQLLPLALMAGGQLVQGIAGYKAGKANKKTTDLNARQELADAEGEASRVHEAARAAMGEQIGSLAGNGFELGGSATTRLMESAIAEEMDVANIRRTARSKAIAWRQQGKTAMAEGRSRLLGGFFGAASSVASGIRDYASAQSEYGYGGSRPGFGGAGAGGSW